MFEPGETELIQFSGWTVRVRRAARQPARLLLMVHGFKGDENSMWVFARGLSPAYWIVAPRAPHAVADGGYSWRADPAPTDQAPGRELYEEATGALLRLADEYSAAAGVDAAQFDAIGFSQGAVVVSLLTLFHPARVQRTGLLAGFVPEGVDQLIADRPLDGKPVFVAHGAQDEMVPVERGRRAVTLLERAGAQVTYCEDAVGHKLSANCLRGLQSFLGD